MPIAEFAYNNAKNTNTSHTLFKLSYSYHSKVLFKEDINFYLRFCSIDKLAKKLKGLMKICCQNLLYTQELQKKAYDKGVKDRNYTLGKKVWLNSKYIKIKKNKKLENKFFKPFWIFHAVGK